MIQREREAEGDEFADKEQFITQAYKDQIAEVRRAEEEEKIREGMSSFTHSTCTLRISLTEMYCSTGTSEKGAFNWNDSFLPSAARAE